MQGVVGRILRHKAGVEGQAIVIFADVWLDFPDVEYYEYDEFKRLIGGTGPLAALVNKGLVPAFNDIKKFYPNITMQDRLLFESLEAAFGAISMSVGNPALFSFL